MKWYKHDPDAFLAGTVELTLEEIGAYSLILDLLYSRDGNVPADDRFMSRALRCRPQMWRRLRDRLMEKGKIRIKTDGKLTANRVENELKTARKLMENMAHLGVVSAEKRKQNKESQSTGPDDTSTSTSTSTSTYKKHGSHVSMRTKATSFPEGWVFGEIEFAAAVAIRSDWTRVKGDQEFQRFHDHALAKGSIYKNWPAAWRNWVGSKFQDNQGGGNGRQQSLSELAFELAGEVREREREVGISRPDDPVRRD